jgi:hypothetical protein
LTPSIRSRSSPRPRRIPSRSSQSSDSGDSWTR